MTAMSAPIARPTRATPGAREDVEAWRKAAIVAAGLAAIVAARFAATRAGLDPIVVGATFGTALLLLAAPDFVRPRIVAGRLAAATPRGLSRSVLIGSAVGLALVAASVLGPALGGFTRMPGLGRPEVAFLPWALVTILVACAEEAVLRGILFDRVARAGGIGPALAITTLAFALLHVPLYGWHVVPLDLAVGLGLGGLRVATRSVVAPAAAHAVADLATWWV